MRLGLKVRMLRAEVIQTLVYGCPVLSPSKTVSGRLQDVSLKMVVRVLAR